MTDSYASNYVKIYFWKGISIVLGFVSMFIVTPMLAGNPEIYGIYSLCISLTIFLSYADIGFLGAGFKYAGEYVGRGELEEEIKIIGFSGFIFILFGSLYISGIVFLSINPQVLISNVSNSENIKIASALLAILALNSINIIIQRIFQIILGIRIADYIAGRLSIIASIFNICSVFYFFDGGSYNIVGYTLFNLSTNSAVTFGIYYFIKKNFNYDFKLLLKSVRFNNQVFIKMKSLAFSSLFVMISWILYFEMDFIGISKLIGVQYVAYYAVIYGLVKFFRSLLGTLYGPFLARFNHLHGVNDADGMKRLLIKLIIISLPVVVFPIVSLMMLMEPFIYSWLGSDYSDSIHLGYLLVAINLFAHIAYPAGFILITLERIRENNVIAIVNVIVFWAGILLTVNIWGIYAFAIFKLATFMLSGAYLMYVAKHYLNMDFWQFINKIYRPVVVALLFMVVSLLFIKNIFPMEKSKTTLFLIITTGGFISCIACLMYAIASKDFRVYISEFVPERYYKLLQSFK